MTQDARTAPSPSAPKPRITIERTYAASIDDAWDLWTTKDGIESWWGPDGFSVEVHTIDLRPGGELRYAMTATAPAQIEFMKRAGMPLTTEGTVTYTEVVSKRRLAYDHLVDFVPGVGSYCVSTLVELHPSAGGVRMVLSLDPMHDEVWTTRAVMGWESELGKLAKVFDTMNRGRQP
jgi:uncharacterized protein YndB with AHSA1/START domain